MFIFLGVRYPKKETSYAGTASKSNQAAKFTASNLYGSPTFSLNIPHVAINQGEHERGQKG